MVYKKENAPISENSLASTVKSTNFLRKNAGYLTFIGLNIGDIVSTYIDLAHGFHEENIIPSSLIAHYGFMGIIFSKALIVGVIGMVRKISFRGSDQREDIGRKAFAGINLLVGAADIFNIGGLALASHLH